MSARAELRRSLAAVTGPAAAMAALAALALWAALLAWNPGLRTARDAALLYAHLLLFHGVLVGVAATALAATLALLAARRPAWALPPRAQRIQCVAITIALAVAGNAILRFPLSYGPFRDFPHRLLTPLGAVDLLAFAGLPCVVFWTLRPFLAAGGGTRARRRAAALLAGWLVLVAVATVWTLRAETPRRHALATLRVPPATPAPTVAAAPAAIVVVGLDGLDWHVLAALLEDGRLPHLRALVARGARANLASALPTLSPALWTSIATGHRPAAHGIHGWHRFRLPGMTAFIAAGPTLGTMNWWNGLNRALAGASHADWVERRPVFGSDWTAPAAWDVAAHHGIPTGVFGWLATWPVVEVGTGSYRVSDTSGRPGSCAPASLAPLLARVGSPPPPWDSDARLAAMVEAWRPDHDDFHRAVHLHRTFQPRLSYVYSQFIDRMQHHWWRGDERGRVLLLPDERRFRAFAPEVVESYALVDHWLGALVAALAPDTAVLVVSDHGFAFDGLEHHFAPDGVLIAAGPGVRAGAVLAAASIHDVAPTVLAALGLPVAATLPGRVLHELFVPGAAPTVARVAAYDWFTPRPLAAPRALEVEEAMRERLRAAGYAE